MIIGMPGETEETIIESAEYNTKLRHVLGMHWLISNPGLLIATPGTPVYEYCQQIGSIGKTIDEEEDYLNNLESFDESVLNYVNMTNSKVKEINYWTYLYNFAGKKEHVNLIFKNNKSFKKRIFQIYDQCLKATYNDNILRYKIWKKKSFKKNIFINKIKFFSSFFIEMFISLLVPILPKKILFKTIKIYADIKFYLLMKNYKHNGSDKKSNLFVSEDAILNDNLNLRITEERIKKFERQAERSLRNIVRENRKILAPAITNEEKGLEILAEGQ
jgi:hypothetical protein